MSHVEQMQAQGSDWAYLLSVLLFVALFFAAPLGAAWLALHGGDHLLTVWRRGRAYRARIRAARHAQPHRLVRSTTR